MPVLFHKDVLMIFFVLQILLIPDIPVNRGKLVYPISANKYSLVDLQHFF
jgi:hypothetical protein